MRGLEYPLPPISFIGRNPNTDRQRFTRGWLTPRFGRPVLCAVCGGCQLLNGVSGRSAQQISAALGLRPRAL